MPYRRKPFIKDIFLLEIGARPKSPREITCFNRWTLSTIGKGRQWTDPLFLSAFSSGCRSQLRDLWSGLALRYSFFVGQHAILNGSQASYPVKYSIQSSGPTRLTFNYEFNHERSLSKALAHAIEPGTSFFLRLISPLLWESFHTNLSIHLLVFSPRTPPH